MNINKKYKRKVQDMSDDKRGEIIADLKQKAHDMKNRPDPSVVSDEDIDKIFMKDKPMAIVNDKAMAAVTADGMILPADSELLKMMNQDSKMGAENIGGNLPLLKVYQPGKTQAVLENGVKPNDGWFYYQPTQSQFQNPECYILSISRGYKAKPMNDQSKEKFTQLLSGAIDHDGKLLPFMMYVTGLKLRPMWDYGKTISKFTNHKTYPIPMFALKTRLSSENVKTDFGYTYVVNYDLVMNDQGFPVILSDRSQYEYLRDKVSEVEATMENIIQKGQSEDAETTIVNA